MSRNRHNIPEPLWRSMTYAQKADEARAAYYAIYDRLTSITAPIGGDRVNSSPRHDKFSALPIYKERWERYQRQYDRAVVEATGVITQINDERYKGILICRYIEALTPQDTAKAMHYSPDRERHLHAEALEAFRAIWRG